MGIYGNFSPTIPKHIMRKISYLAALLLFTLSLSAQKKPLDHSVYDGWQSIGERAISNNGKFVTYTVVPQEGDGMLVIQAADNSFKKEIPRGYGASISQDSRFVIFKIRPFFKDTREARIKKKRPDDMPKDSLGIYEFGKDTVIRIARVKTFKLPTKGDGRWLAYHLEKSLPAAGGPRRQPDSLARISRMERMADSLMRVADSIRNKANEAKQKGLAVLQPPRRDSVPAPKRPDPVEEGTELVLRDLHTGQEYRFPLTKNYVFSEQGNVLVVETSRKNNDTLVQATVQWVSLPDVKTDTVFRIYNEVKNLVLDSEGTKLAFVAERDSAAKALQKFWKLYYYEKGMDSARLRVDRNTAGVAKGYTVSENGLPVFSRDGKKLFFGLAPIRRPKDTTLVEFETARLDIWHYDDDYLQPQQLKQLNNELRRSYTAVLNGNDSKVIPLGAEDAETIQLIDEGNADYVLGLSTKGSRKEQQWLGFTRYTAYIISTVDGSRKLIKQKQRGFLSASPKGKFVLWYDPAAKHYFAYNVSNGTIKNITQKITVPLYNDEDDHPDDPGSFGTAGWLEDDEAVLINDRYDIWQVDPNGVKAPVNITNGYGRKNRTVLRYVRTDPEARFITRGQQLLLEAFNRNTKYDGVFTLKLGAGGDPVKLDMGPYALSFPLKAKAAEAYIVTRMTPEDINVYATSDWKSYTKLSATNPQQQDYIWFKPELVKWKMFDGREAEGLLFKPENFDPKKKYPVIFYFYEKNSDGLYNYRAPAPSASTINIPYFVSNGYLVFDPNIYYKNGEPGESAYNSVVSAAKYLAKMPWVDSTKMAIQGQSWGGYQVAYLVTRTKMFAAAGAGAPVANMTSAYGGIRWGTGLNRQFQYERTQSRIGYTLWQRPDLYIKNSPLFKADKVTTPLLIMHNDNDGAVPWYQGIEFFTALRRLGKKVWMLQYNDEDHNLVERRNRKDLSIRLAQFFDHFLKGAPAAPWIKNGVPATLKGIDWGIEATTQPSF
jgi:dipeptidyl aminopeptidase/acylaminoacyl peptidase